MIVNSLTDRPDYSEEEKMLLSSCTLCPRECGVDRFRGATGYCRTDAGINVASIVVHRGEEPPVSGPEGICNIFFYGCNMRCIYCQNHQISRVGSERYGGFKGFKDVVERIIQILDSGVRAVGFVSPSHMVPQTRAIIRELNRRGYKPVTVYNTNSYEKAETIGGLNGLIDVYLADYKYITNHIAKELSDTENYPAVALRAIKEMYFKKGSSLITDDDGRAVSGLIIRHLILPGHIDESINVLRDIAEQISTGVTISLMSQYDPAFLAVGDPILGRPLDKQEYEKVMDEFKRTGFRKGWYQQLGSNISYRPDFSRENPFEEKD